MHPRNGGEEHTQGDEKAGSEQEGGPVTVWWGGGVTGPQARTPNGTGGCFQETTGQFCAV